MNGFIFTLQQTTAIAETTIAETTTIEDKLSENTTALEEIEPGLFTGFKDATALEDKKSLTVFSAIVVVRCTMCISSLFASLFQWGKCTEKKVMGRLKRAQVNASSTHNIWGRLLKLTLSGLSTSKVETRVYHVKDTG